MSHLLISPSLEQLYTSTLLPSGSGHLFSTVNDWWSGILLFIPKFLEPPWSGEQFSCKTRSSSPSKRLQLMSKWWAGGMLGACTMGQLSMWTILVKSSLPSKDLRFIVCNMHNYLLPTSCHFVTIKSGEIYSHLYRCSHKSICLSLPFTPGLSVLVSFYFMDF